MNDMIEAKIDFESPRIQAVSLGDGEFVLNVSWEGGSVSRVDLTELVYRYRHLRPLRKRERFKTAKVGDWGWDITWGDDLDIPGEQIWKLARAQAEAMMTPGEFRAWLRRHDLTQEGAAELLGVSKRTVSYLATGAHPIDRTIFLALQGAELQLMRERPRPVDAVLESAGEVLVEEASDQPTYDKLDGMVEFLRTTMPDPSRYVGYFGNHSRAHEVFESRAALRGDFTPDEQEALIRDGIKMRVMEGMVSASLSLTPGEFWNSWQRTGMAQRPAQPRGEVDQGRGADKSISKRGPSHATGSRARSST